MTLIFENGLMPKRHDGALALTTPLTGRGRESHCQILQADIVTSPPDIVRIGSVSEI
jgi:hypothetical protein